jgi:hypothetical protein
VERSVVPKLIVLFYGDENNAPAIAEAAADGAKSIRFTEVDLRAGATTATRHKRADSTSSTDTVTAVAEYDGVLLSAPAGRTHDELTTLLHDLRHHGHATNTVFALAAGAPALLEELSRLGGIIVTTPAVADPVEQARQVGARAAKVAGWVRHGLGHEAEHHHDHGHDHKHHHHH